MTFESIRNSFETPASAINEMKRTVSRGSGTSAKRGTRRGRAMRLRRLPIFFIALKEREDTGGKASRPVANIGRQIDISTNELEKGLRLGIGQFAARTVQIEDRGDHDP